MGKTVKEIVKEYFPDVTDKEMEHIVWSNTGYPTFWNMPDDGNTPEECFRKQLKDLKDLLQNEGGMSVDRTV